MRAKTDSTQKGKQARRRTNAQDKGEIVTFDVFLSDDPFETGRESKKEPLGSITFSQNYLKDAAQQFGGGEYYYFLPRHADGSFGAGKTLFCPPVAEAIVDDDLIETEDDLNDSPAAEIERLIDRKLAMMGRQNPSNQQPMSMTDMVAALKSLDDLRSSHEPKNGAADLIGQLRTLEEARKIFAPREQNPRPIETVPPLTTEAALMKLISEDRLSLAAVKEKLLGSDGEAVGWLQMLPTMMPHVERMIAHAADIIRNVRQPQPDSSQLTQQPEPTHSPGAPPNANQQSADAQAYSRIFDRLIMALSTNADVQPVADAVDAFITLFPEHGQMLEGLMTAPAENVLAFIGQSVPQAAQVVSAPHAAEWMRNLQDAFLTEDEGQASQLTTEAAAKGATP